MEPWHFWIILGIVCFIVEIFTPAFFFASLGIGSFSAGVSSYMGGGLTSQLLSLALGTFIVFLGARQFLHLIWPTSVKQKTGIDALIGKSANVLETIDEMDCGRIKIGGEDWRARSLDQSRIEKGCVVQVKKIEGVTAYVVKLIK